MKQIIFLVILSCAACAGPQTQAVVHEPTVSLQEAEQIVADFEASLATDSSPTASAANVTSLDDVLEILRNDQISQFAAGIAFAKTQSGEQARALEGQIELAWADGQQVLADVLSFNAKKRVSESGKQEPETQAKTTEMMRVAQSLRIMAKGHQARGAKIANEIIRTAPKDYVGYRLIADYYRLQLQWKEFGETLDQVQARNPKSNGLIFQQGVASLVRDDKPEAAVGFFKQALSNDPKFVRAQAYLVSAQASLEGMVQEYLNLKKLNPHHQIVTFAGPFFDSLNQQLRSSKIETSLDSTVRHE
jgi:tetratricopeptide (TPR) repeat protein